MTSRSRVIVIGPDGGIGRPACRQARRVGANANHERWSAILIELKYLKYAQMAELVDALVSNTNVFGRAGSTPALGTSVVSTQKRSAKAGLFLFEPC